MAVLDFRGSGSGESGFSLTGKVSRMVNVIGAVTSVMLILGLVVWGYKLVMRDVTGIPVVKAIEGPARVAPEEPGGDLARNTGLAVNQVAADNPAKPAEDPLVLAPAPTALAETDAAMGSMGATAHAPSNPLPTATLMLPEETAPPMTDAEIAARLAVAPTDGLPPAAEGPVTEAVAATAPPTAEEAAAEAAAAAAPVEVKTATDAAVLAAMASPRPSRRPAERAEVVVASAEPAPKAEAVTLTKAAEQPAEKPAEKPVVEAKAEAKPEPKAETKAEAKAEPAPVKSAKVETGTQLAQIGAFDSEEQARTQWARVSKKYGALMAGKEPVLQEHVSNGRTFIRLRVAGFGDSADAKKFCAELSSGGTDCILAKAK